MKNQKGFIQMESGGKETDLVESAIFAKAASDIVGLGERMVVNIKS